MYQKVPQTSKDVALALEAFIEHNATLARSVVIPGIACILTPKPWAYSTALYFGVVVYLWMVSPLYGPKILEDLRKSGQAKLAEDARLTWLASRENWRFVIGGGLAMTAGIWWDLARAIFHIP